MGREVSGGGGGAVAPASRGGQDPLKIVVAGHHGDQTGYGELARLLALALESSPHEIIRHRLYAGPPPKADVILTVSTSEEFWRARCEGALHVGYTMIERQDATKLEGRLIELVDEVLVPSEWNRGAFLRTGTEVPIRVVHHPIDPALRSVRGAPSGPFTFVSVFEWSRPHKDPFALLQAFHAAFGGDPDVVLRIRSNPPPGVDLGPGVEIIPPLPRRGVLELLASADAYVAASRAEGWGIPAFEAIALGVPVVATEFGGGLEYMDPSNTLLVAPRSVENGRAVIDVPGMAHAMRLVRERQTRGERAVPEEFWQKFSIEGTRDSLLRAWSNGGSSAS